MRLIDVETINGTFILNEQYSGREIMALLNQQPTAYDLKAVSYTHLTLFRPPYGDYNNQVVEMADSMGYYPIQWDVETLEMVVKEI